MYQSSRAWKLSLIIAVALFIFNPVRPAQAQTGTFGEEMILFQDIPSVIGASKYEQKVTEAPSSVSIITASEIKKYGYRMLADILRSIRSFTITYDRNYSYVGVRGFGRPGDYNSRILLLVDGHRINDNIYDSAFVGTEFPLDIDLIDRVEVIRGPGSSLYGSNAFFAVINIITRQGRNLKGAELAADAGSFGAYKGRLSFGDKFGGSEGVFSATKYSSEGDSLYFSEYDDPATNNGDTKDTDFDRYKNAYAKYSVGDFTLTGAYSDRMKGIPTGSYGADFNNDGNRTVDGRSYIDIKYEHRLAVGADLAARLYYDFYWYNGSYLYGGVVNRDKSFGEWGGGDIQLSIKKFSGHRLILGAEYQDNLRQDQQNYDEDPWLDYLDDKRSSSRAALYAQNEFTVSRSLIVNAGIRHDRYSTFGGTTNPRLAVIYNPIEKATLKLLYGSAFRAPNVYELYYESPASDPPMVGNPELDPETIRTTEVVYEQYLGERSRGTLAAYIYTIDDLINQTLDTAGNMKYENLEKVKAKGAEAELEQRMESGFTARVSYAVQRAEDKATGEPLNNSAAQTGKLNLTAPLVRERIFAGIEEQYTSRRKTLSNNYAGGYAITNLTILGHATDRLEISAGVYNLFDKSYSEPASGDFIQEVIAQDGRTFRFKVAYAF